MKRSEMFLLLAACAGPILAQAQVNGDYRLALPDHQGQLAWSIDGYKIIENSAKPNGLELGVRGSDASGQVIFLGFLFLAPESTPLTSAKCRDAAMDQAKKANATLKIIRTSEIPRQGGLPVAVVVHTTANRDG